ncbi:carbohydrate ABC transporter permease [Lachnospiraceae bacterium ZAX-1]
MKRKIASICRYVFLSITAILSAFPIYWMIVSATNDNPHILSGSLMPGTHFIDNLNALVKAQSVSVALRNSFMNAIVLTLLSLVICSLAGYGFEVFHSKGKDILMNILLMAMMVPFAATMIPLFRMFAKMNLISSLLAVVLPAVSTPFLIMMFRQSARSFPSDIIEAARLEGVSEIGIFFKFFIPTMRSTYASAMTITFMNAWNNYLWPRVILLDGKHDTMPMLTANLTSGYVTQYGVLMLAVFISTIPTIVIFLVLQKSFTNGIAGAVK